MVTTIQLDENTKELLDKLKVHYRESYNDILKRLIESYKNGTGRESLIETLEIISDPSTMREIAQGIDDFNKGKYKSLKQIKKEIN